MHRYSITPTVLAALLFLIPVSSGAQTSPAAADEVEKRKRAVEDGLLPAVIIEGRDTTRHTIYERMDRHIVPGVGIAVIRDGQLDWAEGYGVKRAGGADSVHATTRFQAASISKPVAAAGVLRLAEEGRVSLDADINEILRSWHVPENGFTERVTLRHLLSHTAGTTVHGFPGYARGEPIATTVEVLHGGGNTDPVIVDVEPGSLWRYSGGGYTIAQLAVSDVTGMPFQDYLREAVLLPLGMKESTFEQPLPARFADDAAVAHGWDGRPIPGDWHTYPEQAAAGLWTTPTDLARFAIGVARAFKGESDAWLSSEMAEAMLTPVLDGTYGLGFGVVGEGAELRFSHGGSNAGYRCFLALYPNTGDGVAVMTNADGGADLSAEILRAVSDVYGWPHNKPDVRVVTAVDPSLLEKYAGEYELAPGVRYTLIPDEGRLLVKGTRRHPQALYPETETVFFGDDIHLQVRFNVDDDGRVGSLSVLRGDNEMRAEKVK